MFILGIETSCDECSAAVVEDGKQILSNIIASQVKDHLPFNGVVPEIASRLHTEWIYSVVDEAVKSAGLVKTDIHGIAVTNRPGLVGSLLVGLSFAKGLAFSLKIPFVGVDHMKAHLYAAHLEQEIEYPYLGVLVSGGHTLIGSVHSFDDIMILGTTIDDAVGEAFDKVARHYELGYPGGVVIDKLSRDGDPDFFDFPDPSLHKGDHDFDVSYSGLKTAVINQLEMFRVIKEREYTKADIAASFQRAAVDILVSRVKRALEKTRYKRIVTGGGVAANSLFRKELNRLDGIETIFPSIKLCTDNGAMVAGIGYHLMKTGGSDSFGVTASPRVYGLEKKYKKHADRYDQPPISDSESLSTHDE